MKKIFTTAASVLALVGTANASDLRGSIKDSGAYVEQVSTSTRSGFYIRGDLGLTTGDRDASASIAGQKNNLDALDDGPEVKNGEPVAGLIDDGMVFRDLLAGRLSDDIDAGVFGGEVGYLWQFPNNRKWGLELALGATIYGDNETATAFGGDPIITGKGPDFPANIYPNVGEANIYSQVGSVSFERDFDIDLIPRLHFFPANNLSIYAGVGLSWARGSLDGKHASDYLVAGAFDNSINDDDTSLGYVLNLGGTWWATDRLTFGLDYTYKKHEFDFDAGRSSDGAVRNSAYRYSVNSNVDIDDEVHAIKARIGYKID